MGDVVGLVFALALGFVLGASAMTVRSIRIAARRRALAGSSAALARIWPTELPERSSADIIAGRIQVVLGGRLYVLPVLPQNAGQRWLASLDEGFAAMLNELGETDDVAAAIGRLMGYSGELYAVLLAYDETHVLPAADEVGEFATSAEIFRAVVEVWRAENPLAATLAGMASTTPSGSSERPSSSPASSDGPPPSSGTSSRASSSSRTSTRRRTGSKAASAASSTAGSRP